MRMREAWSSRMSDRGQGGGRLVRSEAVTTHHKLSSQLGLWTDEMGVGERDSLTNIIIPHPPFTECIENVLVDFVIV